ncbi:hypothetical protein IAR55_001553 [Kwoniella newhampshirensis]|uniref:NAD(P)-binding domain-containing protein n=1 Tax=Kwoniella newhampshirensis TaxID=1651941 RepID=A0AAW0Z2H5_9TREE
MPLPAPILAVTGINGFIASHVALQFLSKGWSVRGSVRSASKAEFVRSNPVFKEWVDKGKFEVIVLGDFNTDDFGPLLEGVEAVAHLAAPNALTGGVSWAEYRDPTVGGVSRLLEAAKDSTTIKGINIMSSAAAAFDPANFATDNESWLVEDDWLPLDEATLVAMDPASPFTTSLWYSGSKKFAELEAYKWVENNKPSWKLATLLAAIVYGPPITLVSPSDMNDVSTTGGSVKDWVALVQGKDKPVPAQFSTVWVDVRDMATAFFETIAQGKSGRFFINAGDYDVQNFVDTMRKLRPDLDAYIPLGEPDKPNKFIHHINSDKSVKDLGMKYRSIEDCVADTLDYLEKIGVFKIPPGAWKKEQVR